MCCWKFDAHLSERTALYNRVAIIDKGVVTEYWEVTSRNRKITI